MTRMLIAAAALAAVSSVAKAQAVPITLAEWKVEMARDTVKAGAVTFRVKNEGTMPHAFHIGGEGFDKETRQIAVGQSATLAVTLKPGTYEVYCPMSELTHKKAGMGKKLVVVAGDAKKP